VSAEDDFDIRIKLGVNPPCYVRKVDRQTHCGKKEDLPEQRALQIRSNVLSEDDGILSVFYVASARDVIRAALALNVQRTGGSRIEDLCLIAFTPGELQGITRNQTPDTFECSWARRNHLDITLTASDQERIARTLAAQNRFPKKFTESKMKGGRDALLADGCRSVKSDSNDCVCER
jgi:hypothetical protein